MKVGDGVKILYKRSTDPFWTPEMDSWVGKEATVFAINESNIFLKRVVLKRGDLTFSFPTGCVTCTDDVISGVKTYTNDIFIKRKKYIKL